ncbi:hypothetical protein BDK92_1012 [Micromonospora pisi]|uniref:LysM domain-containing protein n=1 Tax=Micromonospora pisi TaxID=589240 RepID=A0A495JCV0_9ACTN|nr:hypothetical protein [Micromonospora pisi]RKR86747.1 hypothetical protein BDK92_1012 [Micromonospora pisi]
MRSWVTLGSDRAGRGRVIRLAAVAVIGGLVLGVGGVAALPPSAAPAVPVLAPTPTPTSTGSGPKYYVVGPPQGGQREYLYQIAVRTLGDGNRFREIFELNQGRKQADGGQLTDAMMLEPGWVLELPPDAAGPGVQVGPLPLPTVAEPAGDADSGGKSSGGANPYVLAAVGLAVMVLLLAVLLYVLRGGRRPRTGPPLIEAAPNSPAPEPQPESESESESETQPLPVSVSVSAAVSGAVSGAGRVQPGVAPATGSTAGSATTPPHDDRPELPPPGRVTVDLRSMVDDHRERMNVRLLGAASDVPGTPYAWCGPDEPFPAARMPAVLGRRDGWRFVLDLAATPDVFTITGTVPAVRRQAALLARQLHAAGLTVTIVGDAVGPDLPSGCRRVAAFPVSDSDIGALGERGVIISGGLRGAELTAARGLAARTRRQVVPVLVGEVLRARWSVLVTDPA